MNNVSALAATIQALETAGVLTDAHSAILAALEGMAYQLDDDPSNASLWKVYTQSLNDLLALVDDGPTDTKQSVLEAMQAALCDTSKN